MQLDEILREYSKDWTLKEKVTPTPQIELRRAIRGPQGDSNILVIVATERGYNHSFYSSKPDRWNRSTQNYKLHISTNVAMQLPGSEFLEDLAKLVKLCETYLQEKY